MTTRWDTHFLNLALAHSKMSKDPSTRVGSVIVGPDKELISMGFNGLPRGLADTEERLCNRELKYKLVVHAEMNAVLAGARLGMRLKDTTMYLVAQSVETGLIWGGPPCTRCLVEMLQVGISSIITTSFKNVPSKWREDLLLSVSLIKEVGLHFREIDL